VKNTVYSLEFSVRDYECDLTGIVNNANYQHYLEHTRHEFMKARGVDFAGWFQRGISFVVIRIEMDFLFPLRSGDKFIVTLQPRQVSRLRLGFDQDIYRLPDEKPILKSVVIASAINQRGKPEVPAEVFSLILGA